MFVEELKGLSQVRPLILIWRTQNRVKIAYDYLTNNGVSNCRILEGGITGWVNSGKPVIRGRKSFSLEGQVRAIAGSLMVLGVGLGISVNLWFLLIPVLVGIGLIHAGLTDSCLMGMVAFRLPMNRISPPSIPISRKEVERRIIMNCPRCQGLLISDYLYNKDEALSVLYIWRCLNCGETFDSMIIRN